MCTDLLAALTLLYRVLVVVKQAPEKFGRLKVVLEAIAAVYADHEVRQRPHSQNSPLTTFSGIHRCGKQD